MEKRGSKICKGSSTSSQPQSGVFTRRKWRTYLLSQFGAPSSEDLLSGLLYSRRKKPKKLPNEVPPKDEENLSHFPIKDLRIKRVFSTTLTDESFPSVQSETQVSSKEGVEIAEGFEEAAQVQDLDVCDSNACLTNVNVELGEEDHICNRVSKEFERKSEELQHSTPPDEILARGFRGVSSDGGPPTSYGCIEAMGRPDSVSKSRLVLRPCFKRKLFKAPGSIAYKRLLPYLLDNITCIIQDEPYPKRENHLEKRVKVESDISNCPREGVCEKNAYAMSNHTSKPSLSPSGKISSFVKPLVSGNSETFQNDSPCGNRKYSDSNTDLNLVTEVCGEEGDAVHASYDNKGLTENEGIADFQIEHLSDENHSKTSRLKMLDGGNSSFSSSILSEKDDLKSCASEKLSNNVCKNSKREDDFSEGSIPMALNYEIPRKLVADEMKDEKVDCTWGEGQNPGSSYPRKKLVQNPLSQLKSFRSQGSINYRRMLPFLEDLIKDNSENSCPLGKVDSPNIEVGLATIHSQPMSSNSHNFTDKQEGFSSRIKPCNEKSDTSMTVLATANETLSETENSLISAVGNDRWPAALNLPKQKLQSEDETLGKCKLETDPALHQVEHINDQAVASVTEWGITLYEQSPMTLKDCTRLTGDVFDDAKLPESISSQPNLSCVEACVSSEFPTSIRKGILKRNPRGCRGLCNCLNCSSFRLHAERAFEFSRHQLLDAQEVASDLMKELSYLRHILAKSADSATDDAGYDINKVKEACSKASEAELNAKDRLVQMNYELDIHCRITCSERPSVRFSGDSNKDTEKR